MLGQHLDNSGSLVAIVTEGVKSQPIALDRICLNCSENIEIAILGSEKPVKLLYMSGGGRSRQFQCLVAK